MYALMANLSVDRAFSSLLGEEGLDRELANRIALDSSAAPLVLIAIYHVDHPK